MKIKGTVELPSSSVDLTRQPHYSMFELRAKTVNFCRIKTAIMFGGRERARNVF